MVWIEVKVRKGELVTKERMPCRGPSLPLILSGAEEPPADAAGLRALLLRGELSPVAALHYVRLAFESPDGSLRLTIDRAIHFQRPHRPGDHVADVAKMDGCIIEVKSTGAIPSWLEQAMRNHPIAAISKFELALRATGTE